MAQDRIRTEKETDRHRQTDRQLTDRLTETETDRDRLTDILTDRDRQTETQRDRQTERHRETDR